ncbi:hypothetical protein IW261DRAFT_1659746 [Armillaria novae-zelandiae]|uniref:Uncharacterized protein n=1 Tax=Armillaria novae-zelandiae TaxID=153914 RepID=A0AA39NWD3_9AGAR|nr:hypothetical protein IW261DRAFT_1659746 [Armillaria novae-zelandiae]
MKTALNEPWLFLMGTFDGHDETTLPKVYKDFAVTVCTSGQHEVDEGLLHSDNSRMGDVYARQDTKAGHTLPSVGFVGEDTILAYNMDPMEIQKLIGYSQDEVEDFFQKLYSDRRYVKKVARELNKYEIQYRAQKKGEYAASRKSFTLQRLTPGMKSMRLNNATNTAFDHASVQRSSPQKTKPAASVYSKASVRVIL